VEIAVWVLVAVAAGYWACLRAASDVKRQRRLGHTFGEAHITEHRLTTVVVPALSGGIVALYLAQHESADLLVAFVACTATGLRVSLVDIDTHTIPRRVMVTSIGVLLVLLTIAAFTNSAVSMRSVMIGGIASWLVMRIIEFVSRGDVGHADVVLSGYLGLFVGAKGLRLIPVAFFSAFVSAGLVAVVLMVSKRLTRRSHIPFGPFLVFGMVLAVLR
jgi:leader peptidase (prepilin peptidase)/N-methyltransferase